MYWLRSEIESMDSPDSWFQRLRNIVIETLLPVLNIWCPDHGRKTSKYANQECPASYLYSSYTLPPKNTAMIDGYIPPVQFPILDLDLKGWKEVLSGTEIYTVLKLNESWEDNMSDDFFQDKPDEWTSAIPSEVTEHARVFAVKVEEQFQRHIEENTDPVKSFYVRN